MSWNESVGTTRFPLFLPLQKSVTEKATRELEATKARLGRVEVEVREAATTNLRLQQVRHGLGSRSASSLQSINCFTTLM